MVADEIPGFWAVVPAGGAGTRLWPLSRSGSPKFLHDLTGTGHSLLEQTRDRLAPLVAERLLVVTGAAHEDAVRGQLTGLPGDAVVAEPSARDSMAAIGLAAAILEHRGAEVMGSFAADHVIPDAAAFRAAVAEAVAAARDGWLVTIGIEPTFPSSAFGYVRQGDPLAGHPTARQVVEFVEKPSVPVAEEYLATGSYRWNAGMFVVRPTVLLDLLAEQDPTFAANLRTIAAEPGRLPSCGTGCPGSRSTTPSPSPPPRPAASSPSPAPSAGTTSATSTPSPDSSATRRTARSSATPRSRR